MGTTSNVSMVIAGREIGPSEPVFVIAELSGNHRQELSEAKELVHAAHEAGADAVKLQTYSADTLTIPCDNEHFRIGGGTAWDGRTLYDLYQEASTPWEWHAELGELATSLGLIWFSTPFDTTAVDFLEELDVPCYKVASFELVDIPLLRYIAQQGRPIIASTGMASLSEIDEALATLRGESENDVALLKCTSAYPAPVEAANLRTIPNLSETFGVISGLSDHTLGIAVPVTAVALGACVIEKHLCLERCRGGPDAGFSLEPAEFQEMVRSVRAASSALGRVQYGCQPHEVPSRVFRRSLFVVRPIRSGELLTADNVRSIRPGHGLPPNQFERVLGRRAARDLPAGTPLSWDDIA